MNKAMKMWGEDLHRIYGSRLPVNYMCFDMETTGTDQQTDWPLEFGHCIVTDRIPVSRGSKILNWALVMSPKEQRGFWHRVGEVGESMRAKIARLNTGGHWRLTREFIEKHGHNPIRILEYYIKVLEANRNAGGFFVGHNAWGFDIPLFEQLIWRYDLPAWEFGPMEVFDTGGMEKAANMLALEGIRRDPLPGETLEDYFKAIANIRSYVRWSMDHCIAKYDFATRYGVRPEESHQAGPDAYCCHLLYEEHRFNGNKKRNENRNRVHRKVPARQIKRRLQLRARC